MPIMFIEVRKTYTKEEEIRIMAAVHDAMRQAFNIASNDIHVRLAVYEPHRFSIPVTEPELYPQPEWYTQISIDCYEGRTLETKRNLYRQIVDNLAAFGIPKDHIKIVIRETSRENWGMRGGQAGCDIEVGYSIKV